MREILFRGFHPDKNGQTEITLNGEKIKGEWIEGLPYKKPAGSIAINAIFCNDYFEDDFGGVYGHSENVIPETVGQYTGLTDKNGKKIFDGDIVKYKSPAVSKIGVIGYAFCEFKIYKTTELKSSQSYPIICCEYEEVIGNIHNNPELLEGERK